MLRYGMSFGPIIMILVLATVATVEIQFVGWLVGAHGRGFTSTGKHLRRCSISPRNTVRKEIEQDEFEEKKRLHQR